MSSYLLFLGVGDFERVSRQVEGVDVGVVVPRGDLAQAGFALDAAANILPYYDAYFGVKYPLPKLDLIGGPGTSQFFAAMENWGAIFFFDRDLLVDPRISSESDRQNVYIDVAHEMAHQWFGDLVTMQWWDDLWLNEGFASWMENKVTDHFHPEWHVWLQELQDKQGAMQTDARDGTHPVIQPVHDILQASDAFDDITYSKGASIIRMLESYTGEDAWRAGVRRYIAAHEYANAVTDDLWREIDAVSPRKITAIAHDFTLQAGVPMIDVRQGGCAGDRASGRLFLSQSRFGLDAADKAPRTWSVPVAVQGSVEGVQIVLATGAGEQAVKTNCPSIVNAGQTGYFRTLYDPRAFVGIRDRYAGLPADDQLGVFNDAASEGYAGYAPMAAFLDLTTKLPATADPVIWTAVAERLVGLDKLYQGLPGQAAFRAYAVGVLGPVYARLGWDAGADEPANTATERATLIGALGRMGDPAVIAEARRRFATLSSGGRLDPATRQVVLNIVAMRADAATWDALHALARNAKSPVEKQDYYALLGLAEDPTLARRAMDLAISGEPEATTGPLILDDVSFSHPALVVDFTIAHMAEIAPHLESTYKDALVPTLAASGSDLQLISTLDAYAAQHTPPGDRGELRKSEASIRYNAEVRADRLPEVDRWLAARRG